MVVVNVRRGVMVCLGIVRLKKTMQGTDEKQKLKCRSVIG